MKIESQQSRNRILIVLFVGVLMGALDIAVVGPALPAIQTDFSVDDRALSWVFSIYVLFNLIGTLLMAKLSDQYGRRTIYVLDVSLFALGSAVAFLSPTFTVLLLGRAIQGLGAGGIFPVASAVIGDTFPVEKRGSALGLIGAVFGLAFLVGPILGAAVLYYLSWQWLFIINIPIALILIFLSLRTLPNARQEPTTTFDVAGMVVIALSLGSLTVGINRLDPANLSPDNLVVSITSTDVWPFLLFALLLIPLFWILESRSPDPVLRIHLFSSRQIVLLCAIAFGAGLGEAAVVFVPSLTVATFAVSEATASIMLLPAVLAMAIGAPISGRMLDKVGSRVVVVAAAALVATGMVLIGTLTITLVSFYSSALLVGLGLGMLLGAPLRYIMLNEAPVEDRAAGQGSITLFTSTGQLIGGALVGAVAASMGGGLAGYQTALLVIGGILALITMVAFGLKSRSQELATLQDDVVQLR